MADFFIMTESCCDLDAKVEQQPLFGVVPLHLTVGQRNYRHYLDNRELSPEAFYEQLRQKQRASTAAPSPEDFVAVAEPALQAGHDLLYIGIASTLSATFGAGLAGLSELKARYPERDIQAVDSNCGSLGEGLLVEMALEARAQGKSLHETIALLEANKNNMVHAFTVDDLHHLHRGGRLTAYAALLGSVLQFKPIIALGEDGKLKAAEKVRGMHKALQALAGRVARQAADLGRQVIYIAHADCLDKAQQLAGQLKALGCKNLRINMLGPVIGAHGGPGALGVFFLGKHR